MHPKLEGSRPDLRYDLAEMRVARGNQQLALRSPLAARASNWAKGLGAPTPQVQGSPHPWQRGISYRSGRFPWLDMLGYLM